MSLKLIKTAPIVSACAAAAAIAFGPTAFAEEPNQCTDASGAIVCEEPGNASVMAPPPAVGGQSGGGNAANEQNGPYGPAGVTPPVGN